MNNYTRTPRVLTNLVPYFNQQIDVRRVFARVGKPYDTGALRSYTDVGCYPITYFAADGECLCPKCATEQARCRRDWPRIVDADVIWEGDAGLCSNCNNPIETAYGDD